MEVVTEAESDWRGRAASAFYVFAQSHTHTHTPAFTVLKEGARLEAAPPPLSPSCFTLLRLC